MEKGVFSSFCLPSSSSSLLYAPFRCYFRSLAWNSTTFRQKKSYFRRVNIHSTQSYCCCYFLCKEKCQLHRKYCTIPTFSPQGKGCNFEPYSFLAPSTHVPPSPRLPFVTQVMKTDREEKKEEKCWQKTLYLSFPPSS